MIFDPNLSVCEEEGETSTMCDFLINWEFYYQVREGDGEGMSDLPPSLPASAGTEHHVTQRFSQSNTAITNTTNINKINITNTNNNTTNTNSSIVT